MRTAYSQLIFLFIFLLSLAAFAQDKPQRSKQLDFEDNVVEGMNKNPLDFLEHVAKKDSKGQMPLYKKRTNFRNEMKTTSHELGYVP